MIIVFGFYNSNGLSVMKEKIISLFALSNRVLATSHKNTSIREVVFLTHILQDLPTFFFQGWSNEQGTDFLFLQFLLVYVHHKILLSLMLVK